jgi:sortase A
MRMTLLEKKRHRENRYQERRARRREYRRKQRRAGLFVFIGLIVLTLIALAFLGPDLITGSNSGPAEQAEEPTVAQQTPETTSSEKASDKEKTSEEEATPVPPDDPTMFLTIPKLNIYDVQVTDDVSEEVGLALGVGHLPGTGFPWEKGANTYIAGHRLGYPGTPSDHIFYNLPSLEKGDEITLRDTNDQEYKYRVSDVLQVLPTDLSVMDPVEDRDMVSLQTCIEDFGDFTTLGPDWNVRLIVQADRVT